MSQKNIVLDVKNLKVQFFTDQGSITAVNNISFCLHEQEILGIVGESGSGKTVSNMSIMRIYDDMSSVTISGDILFRETNLMQLSKKEMRKIRGNKIAMIFQNPMSCLNPFLTVGQQIIETIMLHTPMSKKDARDRAVEMLQKVHIPDPSKRISQYPHHFSGGMRQRVMIAIALCCEPEILIADEPTTALDVTVQAQILDLIEELMEKFNTAIIFITHDMGVVARLCQQVCVMYAGSIVEYASVNDIFHHPKHPYTEGLLQSIPHLSTDLDAYLKSIPGSPPDLMNLPNGCSFAPRCSYASEKCKSTMPDISFLKQKKVLHPSHYYRCFHPVH